MTESHEQILRQIEQTYTSLADPKYFTISDAMSRQPYESLMDTVGGQFDVVDTTDDNDDVSFIYGLSHDTREWALGLSVVGPYAVFARTDPGNQLWTEILTPSTPDLDEYERWLVNALHRQGLQLLGQKELEEPVGLAIAGMEPSHIRTYQALFTAADILPWDADTLGRLGLI